MLERWAKSLIYSRKSITLCLTFCEAILFRRLLGSCYACYFRSLCYPCILFSCFVALLLCCLIFPNSFRFFFCFVWFFVGFYGGTSLLCSRVQSHIIRFSSISCYLLEIQTAVCCNDHKRSVLYLYFYTHSTPKR